MTLFEPTRALRGAPGFLLLAPNTGLKVYTPSWHHAMYFLPVGRPMPDLSQTDDDNWYHRVPDLVRTAGTRRHISFLNTPSDQHADDLEPTPYELLRHTARSLGADARPGWQNLFSRNGHRRSALPDPTVSVLMQGMLYGYPKLPYWRYPIDRALVLLSPPLTMAVQALLHSDEAVGQLFHGGGHCEDVSGGPNVLRIYRHPRREPVPDDWRLVRASPPLMSPGRAGRDRLLCQLVRPAEGVRLTCPSPVDRASALKPWGTVIRRLTVAEQLRVLASAFDADLMRAVFLGTRYEPDLPRWLTRTPDAHPVG